MSNEDRIVSILFVAAAFAIGCVCTGISTQRYYEREAVKRGFAEYNSKTGEWQWKGNSNADR